MVLLWVPVLIVLLCFCTQESILDALFNLLDSLDDL